MEIEPKTPAGYFNYFVERNEVYDEVAEEKYASIGLRKPLK